MIQVPQKNQNPCVQPSLTTTLGSRMSTLDTESGDRSPSSLWLVTRLQSRFEQQPEGFIRKALRVVGEHLWRAVGPMVLACLYMLKLFVPLVLWILAASGAMAIIVLVVMILQYHL